MDPEVRRWLQFSPEDLGTLLMLVEDGCQETDTVEGEMILNQLREARRKQRESE